MLDVKLGNHLKKLKTLSKIKGCGCYLIIVIKQTNNNYWEKTNDRTLIRTIFYSLPNQFNEVIRVIVQVFYDEYVSLPTTEDGWKAELDAFLKDWGFPRLGAWDGFQVYISSYLKKIFNFKKREKILCYK